MEERADAIVLRPVGPSVDKLSWDDTAREMARGGEDWSAWDVVSADGLDTVLLAKKPFAVAERRARYKARPRVGKHARNLPGRS